MEAQPAKRNFLRRTKATAPPETTEATTDNTENTTNKFTKRGQSKFKTRKELEKSVEKNEIENSSRRPSLSGVPRRSERPPATRKFVSRRRPGGANSSTPATPSSSASTLAGATSRRPFRIASRRKPVAATTSTTTTTTQATTSVYEDDESLQEIGDTDAIDDPSLVTSVPKSSAKVQRRPLINLKEAASDQNPSATNEDENKRQSKKFSSSIKQNQLDDLVKKSQEESSTESKTTVEDFSPETAVAIAAHQLITAPVPIITDFDEEDVKPTRKSQTTYEYKYTSRQYNEYTENRTPTYDDQTTPTYKIGLDNDETTAYKTDFDSTKVSDVDASKTTVNKYPTTGEYKTIEYVQTTSGESYSNFDTPKISTYDVAKSTIFPNTANTVTNQDYRTTSNDYSVSEFDSPNVTPTAFSAKSVTTNVPTNKDSSLEFIRTTIDDLYNARNSNFKPSPYLPESTRFPQDYIRSTGNTFPETSTEFITRNSPSFVSKFTTGPNTINTEYVRTTASNLFKSSLADNLPKISTALAPPPTPSQGLEKATVTLAENSGRSSTFFTPRSTQATKQGKAFGSDLTANVVTSGYSGIQRGAGRFRNEKLIPVPVDNSGYSTVGYSGANQEPSYFTREYLLESPVTKTYDDEFQYLSPITTPRTTTPPSRKVIRKKIHRKISTTLRPTTAAPPSTTTVVPRRVPAKPFEKVSKEPKKSYPSIANYDYYDDSEEKAVKYMEKMKVVLHTNGNIECLDIGNFPHPSSCKKFISCARIENGSLLGWEYICPKGLSFDPVGGICNWSAGLGCNEKDL